MNRSAALLRADVYELLHSSDGRAFTLATVVAISRMKSVFVMRLSSWRSGALSHPMLSPVGSIKVIYNNKVTAIFSYVRGETADFPLIIEVYHPIK